MRNAIFAAAAITVLGSASALAQATTTTDNPPNGTSAEKMRPTGAPGMGSNPTPANPTAMAPANPTQAPTQPVPKDGPSFVTLQSADMLTSNVVGLDIYNSQNDDIGKVQDVAFDSSKKVTGYILSVGGFLGMGKHYVAVNPDALLVNYDAQSKTWKATMNTTKDQLKSAPEFRYEGEWTASKS